MTISEIRNLVAEAKLEKALKEALALARGRSDGDLENTITLLTGRYNANERSNNMGLSTSSDYERARAQISYSLLDLLNDVDDGGDAPQADQVIKPQPPADEVLNITFLAANPTETAKLQLRNEHSSVIQRLQAADKYNKFRLLYEQMVTPLNFQEFLIKQRPDIVHFSGHGDYRKNDVQDVMSRAGRPVPAENKPAESGIILLDEDGRGPHFVGTSFLKRTFRVLMEDLKIPIKAVIFNACYSEGQAKAVSEVVPYVVGTSWAVKDNAAIAFATGFYFGVAQGYEIPAAVNLGINAAMAYDEPEDRFLLYKGGQQVKL